MAQTLALRMRKAKKYWHMFMMMRLQVSLLARVLIQT